MSAPSTDDTANTSSASSAPAPAPRQPITSPTPAPAPEKKPEPIKPTYEATIFNYTPIDPATLQVVVQVKNTSAVAGKPSCTVQARNESYTYKGFDTFDLDKTVEPGQLYTFRGNLTITKEGSAYVTHAEAKCK